MDCEKIEKNLKFLYKHKLLFLSPIFFLIFFFSDVLPIFQKIWTRNFEICFLVACAVSVLWGLYIVFSSWKTLTKSHSCLQILSIVIILALDSVVTRYATTTSGNIFVWKQGKMLHSWRIA